MRTKRSSPSKEHDRTVLAKPHEKDGDDRRARERLCVATRLVRPVGELIRFVPSPDGVLTPDLKCVLPGRGVWVSATRRAFEAAVKKKAFARSLKSPVTLPEGMADLIEGLLERAALDMLSFANKAGLVASGHAKVMERIEAQAAVAVIQAVDGAEDGARKLASAIRRAYVEARAPVLITNFRSAHLDLALGRTNVIHAALAAGPAVSGFLERVVALDLWRDGPLAPAGDGTAGSDALHADDEPTSQDARPATDGVIGTLDERPGRPAGFGTE